MLFSEGTLLCGLLKEYVNAVNDPNAVPCLDNAWQNTVNLLRAKLIHLSITLPVYLPFYPFTCLPYHPPTNLPFHLPTYIASKPPIQLHPNCLPTCRSCHPLTRHHTNPSTWYLHTHPSTHLTFHLLTTCTLIHIPT